MPEIWNKLFERRWGWYKNTCLSALHTNIVIQFHLGILNFSKLELRSQYLRTRIHRVAQLWCLQIVPESCLDDNKSEGGLYGSILDLSEHLQWNELHFLAAIINPCWKKYTLSQQIQEQSKLLSLIKDWSVLRHAGWIMYLKTDNQSCLRLIFIYIMQCTKQRDLIVEYVVLYWIFSTFETFVFCRVYL